MRISFPGFFRRWAGERSGRSRALARRKRPLQSESLEGRQLLTARLVSEVTGGSTDTVVTGTVYQDTNSNGIKDGGEDGLTGWRVYLDLDDSGSWNTDAVGVLEPSGLTNVDGDYVINRLQPGAYRVAEVLPEGWSPTAPMSHDVTVQLHKDTKADFFNFAGGSVVGTVWSDLGEDGVRDVDAETGEFTDPPLAGWTLFVDLNSNDLRDTGEPMTTTGADGFYQLENLPPDEYKLYVEVPAGWDSTAGDDFKKNVFVTPLGTATADFGLFTTSSGGTLGYVWNDVNMDGVRDVDAVTGAFTEPGLEGWTVFVDLDLNGTQDGGEPAATTDSFGAYTFTALAAGDYQMVLVLAEGWSLASGFDQSYDVTVEAGGTALVPDFAAFSVGNGSLRGTVWKDRFRDGVRDADPLTGAFLDPPLAGWTVFLDLNVDGLLDSGEPSTLTDAAGEYRFTDLQVGEFRVTEVLPAGWETTEGHDSSESLLVYAGTETVAPDFANYDLSSVLPGTIQGTVWNDVNGNGVRDSSVGGFTDPGLSGWVVYVDANGSGTLDIGEAQATSSATGAYSLTGISPGTVVLREVPASGWTPTAPAVGARTLALRNNQTITGVDFGNYAVQEASIEGLVFADSNQNGVRDVGEPGIVGATVYLDGNNNGVLDAGEESQSTSADLFYTPAINEAGTYRFSHLAAGAYTVRALLSASLSATPADQLVHVVTLAATETRTGVNTAARYRPGEIHGVCFDDSDGDHTRDAGEAGLSGVTVFIDLDRDSVRDLSEPYTTTGPDGSYSFTGLDPGGYIVHQELETERSSTYPETYSGTLWPPGTSNSAVGLVSPLAIQSSLSTGQSLQQSVSITLPNTGALTSMVDVFLLFDDTGSFVYNSPIVRSAFPEIITQLQAALPGIDLGFGVGRFEEYGNFAAEYASGRPFILNQAIVAASTPGYLTSIQAALDRTTPGYGGDGPETDIEALYQLVTGRGFDGNNNGSVLDSGPAGLASTQLNPGASGDVPSFASYQADAANSVLPAAGTLGGAGFRAGALPIVLTATDIGFAYQPKGETVLTGVSGVTLPVSSLTADSRSTTPFNYGAGLQETITGLNALGALVIGLGTNADANLAPRKSLESLSRLTGAVNRSATSIANGTADPIAPGDPLYFQIATGFSSSVSSGVVSAIQNAVTTVAMDITLRASDPSVTIINHTGTRTSIGAGQTAQFDVEFIGDGRPHRFDLQFVRAGTNVVLGSIPVVLGTPVSGNGYEYEDLEEGEVHHSSDFGSRSSSSTGNLAPTNVALSNSTVAENSAVGTTVGILSTTDPNGAGSFTYSPIGGDTASFQIVGNTLRTNAAINYEAKSSYSVTVQTTDSGGLSFSKAFTIAVTDVNEAPTDIQLSSASVPENSASGTTVGSLSSIDPDAADSFMYSLVGGDVTDFTIVGNTLKTAANFDYETKSSYSVTVRTTDAGGLSHDKVFAVGVTDVGGLPSVLNVPGTALTYAENAAALLFNGSGAIADPDTSSFTGGRLVVDFASGGQVEDRISVLHQGTAAGQIGVAGTTISYGGITLGSWSRSADELVLTVTLDGTAPLAAVNALVKRLAFVNLGDDPSSTMRQVRLQLWDGLGENSLAVLRPISVTAVNDRPVVTTTSAGTSYLENGSAILVDSGLVVADPDSPKFTGGSLVVQFASGSVSSDRLGILIEGSGAGQVGLSGSTVLYGGVAVGTYAGGVTSNGTLTITFNSNATQAIVQAVGRRVSYWNAGDNPTASTRTVRFTVNDGAGGTSLAATRTIGVTPVNDIPVITLKTGATSFTENGVAKAVDSSAVVADPDSPNFGSGALVVQFASGALSTDRLSVINSGTAAGKIGVSGSSITYGGVVIGSFAGGFIDNSTLTVTFNSSATVAAVQALVKAVAFQAVGDDPVGGVRTVQLMVSDGNGGTSVAKTRTVSVNAVNDVPLLTPSAGTAAYTENGAAIVVDSGMVVADPDSPNVAGGTLKVSFASGSVATDRLVILAEGTSPGQVSLSGTNVLVGGVIVGTYGGVSSSNAAMTITWNANATPVQVQAVARRVAFHNTGDNPTGTSRVVSFVLTDGDGGTSATKSRTVVVTPLNDASVLADPTAATVSYTEAAAAVLLTTTATVQDVDSLDFAGGRLTVSIPVGGSLDDVLEIRNVGSAAGQIGYSAGAVTYGGVSIGTATGGSGGTSLVVSLNASATPTAVQTLLRNITFRVAGALTASSSRTVRFVLEDGDGGTSNSLDKSLNVINLP